MGKRVAIVIAVENYSDSRIKKVSYAEADAQGFADALEVAGPMDKVLLLSAKATKTSINSKIGQHVKSLTHEDELFLFYAGHGLFEERPQLHHLPRHRSGRSCRHQYQPAEHTQNLREIGVQAHRPVP